MVSIMKTKIDNGACWYAQGFRSFRHACCSRGGINRSWEAGTFRANFQWMSDLGSGAESVERYEDWLWMRGIKDLWMLKSLDEGHVKSVFSLIDGACEGVFQSSLLSVMTRSDMLRISPEHGCLLPVVSCSLLRPVLAFWKEKMHRQWKQVVTWE